MQHSILWGLIQHRKLGLCWMRWVLCENVGGCCYVGDARGRFGWMINYKERTFIYHYVSSVLSRVWWRTCAGQWRQPINFGAMHCNWKAFRLLTQCSEPNRDNNKMLQKAFDSWPFVILFYFSTYNDLRAFFAKWQPFTSQRQLPRQRKREPLLSTIVNFQKKVT